MSTLDYFILVNLVIILSPHNWFFLCLHSMSRFTLETFYVLSTRRQNWEKMFFLTYLKALKLRWRDFCPRVGPYVLSITFIYNCTFLWSNWSFSVYFIISSFFHSFLLRFATAPPCYSVHWLTGYLGLLASKKRNVDKGM